LFVSTKYQINIKRGGNQDRAHPYSNFVSLSCELFGAIGEA
jgi:hypothetical protein